MIHIKNLYLKKRIPEISHLNLQIDNGESYVLLSSGDIAVDHLTNIFLELEKDYKGTVEIDGKNILTNDSIGANVVYLSNGSQWPQDMKIGSMITFLKKKMKIPEDQFEELYVKLNIETIYKKQINDLEDMEWRKILFSICQLKESKNYIFRDFARDMPLDFKIEFKRNIYQMKKKDCALLHFSNDVFFAPEIGDRIGFFKKGKLLLELKASKMKKMSSKELYYQFLIEGD
jgi:ABC-type multidrug transport system ATPase subunit